MTVNRVGLSIVAMLLAETAAARESCKIENAGPADEWRFVQVCDVDRGQIVLGQAIKDGDSKEVTVSGERIRVDHKFPGWTTYATRPVVTCKGGNTISLARPSRYRFIVNWYSARPSIQLVESPWCVGAISRVRVPAAAAVGGGGHVRRQDHRAVRAGLRRRWRRRRRRGGGGGGGGGSWGQKLKIRLLGRLCDLILPSTSKPQSSGPHMYSESSLNSVWK